MYSPWSAPPSPLFSIDIESEAVFKKKLTNNRNHFILILASKNVVKCNIMYERDSKGQGISYFYAKKIVAGQTTLWYFSPLLLFLSNNKIIKTKIISNAVIMYPPFSKISL